MNLKLNDVYGSIDDQVKTIKILIKVDHIRRIMKENILSGGFMNSDMENVPSKPSAARVIFFGSGKFLV